MVHFFFALLPLQERTYKKIVFSCVSPDHWMEAKCLPPTDSCTSIHFYGLFHFCTSVLYNAYHLTSPMSGSRKWTGVTKAGQIFLCEHVSQPLLTNIRVLTIARLAFVFMAKKSFKKPSSQKCFFLLFLVNLYVWISPENILFSCNSLKALFSWSWLFGQTWWYFAPKATLIVKMWDESSF